MSSEPNQDPELKGGHPPAVKVAGGVRITQHKHAQEGEQKTKEEVDEEKKQQQIAAAAGHDQRVLIAGAPSKGDRDFTAESVKSFHEKPLPTNQQSHAPPPCRVFQPQKQ